MKQRIIAPERLPDLLRAMPKAELHMHIEGSLEPELIFAMGQRNAVALSYPSVQALRNAYVFNNLQEFLDIYHQGTMVLKTEQDFYDMACAYLARAQADNVLHAELFAKARKLGFRLTAHAGEEGPPEYIWNALDVLKVERINHGVQAIKDARLMQRLVKDRIPLTVCPLSNLKLCVYPTLSQHSIKRMLDAGIVGTINSDDPAYFGGYINENFTQTFAALGLDAQHAYQLALNSFNASFIEPSARAKLVDRLNEVFATFV